MAFGYKDEIGGISFPTSEADVTKRSYDSGVTTGRFSISHISGNDVTFANAYYRVGGKTHSISNPTITVPSSYIVALVINMTGSTPLATLDTFSSMQDLNTKEADLNFFVSPLYKFGSGMDIECDFRIGPDAPTGEF